MSQALLAGSQKVEESTTSLAQLVRERQEVRMTLRSFADLLQREHESVVRDCQLFVSDKLCASCSMSLYADYMTRAEQVALHRICRDCRCDCP